MNKETMRVIRILCVLFASILTITVVFLQLSMDVGWFDTSWKIIAVLWNFTAVFLWINDLVCDSLYKF